MHFLHTAQYVIICTTIRIYVKRVEKCFNCAVSEAAGAARLVQIILARKQLLIMLPIYYTSSTRLCKWSFSQLLLMREHIFSSMASITYTTCRGYSTCMIIPTAVEHVCWRFDFSSGNLKWATYKNKNLWTLIIILIIHNINQSVLLYLILLLMSIFNPSSLVLNYLW